MSTKTLREHFANYLEDSNLPDPVVALICSSGIDRHIKMYENSNHVLLTKVKGLKQVVKLPGVKGHEDLRVCIATIGGRSVLVFIGRIHLYQGKHAAKLLQRQYKLMKEFGIKAVVISSTVGTLRDCVRVGMLGIVTGSGTMQSLGIKLEGFPKPDTAVDQVHVEAVLTYFAADFSVVPVNHIWVMGPEIETALVRRMMRQLDGDVAGMSWLPAIALMAKLGGMKGVGLGMVVNGDDHTHDTVLEAVDRHGPRWGPQIANVIAVIAHE